jgi:hypothetical protein
MAQKLMAHVVARAQCALLKAHGGLAKAALTSLEDENRESLARRFPYTQRKRLTVISRE